MNTIAPPHRRRSVRLPEFDYSQAGAYFITIAACEHRCLFGEITHSEMRLNHCGKIVSDEWQRLPEHFPGVELGPFVVMPNHIHGIIIIHAHEPVGATQAGALNATGIQHGSPQRASVEPSGLDDHGGATLVNDPAGSDADGGSPLRVRGPHGPTPGSIGAMVGQFKSRVTKRLAAQGETLPGAPVWQRNYYEHVIRNAEEYRRIQQYVECNPALWKEDVLIPTLQMYQEKARRKSAGPGV